MRRVAGNTLALFASHFSSLLFTLIQAKIIALELGPSGFGVYASAVAAGAVLGVLVELGLPFVLLRYIPLFETRGEREKSRDLVRFSLLLSSLLAAVLIVLVAAFGDQISRVFKESPLGAGILLLSSTYVALGVLRAIVYGAYNGLARMSLTLLFEFLFQGLVTLWLLVVRKRLDVPTLFEINIMVGSVVVLASAATLWFLFLKDGKKKLRPLSSVRETLGFWRGASLMTLIGLGLENSDRLVVGANMPFQAVSLLHVSSRILYFFKKLLFLPLLAVSPEITAKREKGNQDIRKDVLLLMKLEFLLGFLVLSFIVLGKRALIVLATSKEFAAGEPFLLFMAFLIPPACLYSSVTTALRATGRIGLAVGSDLSWYLIYLLFGVLLIGRFGLWGMMFSQGVSSVFVLCLNIYFARVYLDVSFGGIFTRRFVFSVSPALVLSFLLGWIFRSSSILVVLLLTLPVLLIFNLGIAFGRIFSDDERKRIEELLANRTLIGAVRFFLDWPKKVSGLRGIERE